MSSLFFSLSIFEISNSISFLRRSFFSRTTDSIKNIESVSKQVENGDLTVRIKLDSKDELTDLAGIINQIFGNLNKIVADLFTASKEIKASSEITYEAAENTLQGAEQTSQSTAQLAQGAQETETSMNTLSDLARQLSEHVRRFDV